MTSESGGYPSAPQDPSGWQPETAQRGEPPSTVENAFRLMLVRSAISVLSIIVLFSTKDDLKKRILEKTSTASQSTIQSTLDTALNVGVVVGVIFLVLYILLAFQVRRGRNWARIVTWVLAGLGILGALIGLAQPAPPLSRVISLVIGLIDLAIVILLAQRPSNAYFRGRPAH